VCELESIAERLLNSFIEVGGIVQADDDYEHLVAITDRLREEIAEDQVILGQLLKTKTPAPLDPAVSGLIRVINAMQRRFRAKVSLLCDSPRVVLQRLSEMGSAA
jgi:hypothetical protein